MLSLGVATWVLACPLHADDPVANDNITVTFANGGSSLIPCKFILNSILIPIPTPDKNHAYLILDTGAAAPMLSEAFADKTHIRGSGALPAIGVGQSVSNGSVSTSINFSLSGLTFHGAHWAILPNVSLDSSFGLPVVGVLGLDLLRGLVVRIDYAKQTVEFMTREAFHAPADAVALPITPGDAGCMVPAKVITAQHQDGGQFLFDTGNNGALDLSRNFQDRHPAMQFKPFAQSGASGVGGTLLISEAICPALDLGGIRVTGPLVDLDQASQGAEAIMDGGIGNEIWRRFTVTLDLPDKKLYLQKNGHFADPFSYVTAGMKVEASGDNYSTLTVGDVLPGSDSERAGFQAGDVLLKVDELGSAPLTMANVYPLLHRAGTVHVLIQRGDSTVPLRLELK
jgi:hypothetical protein